MQVAVSSVFEPGILYIWLRLKQGDRLLLFLILERDLRSFKKRGCNGEGLSPTRRRASAVRARRDARMTWHSNESRLEFRSDSPNLQILSQVDNQPLVHGALMRIRVFSNQNQCIAIRHCIVNEERKKVIQQNERASKHWS